MYLILCDLPMGIRIMRKQSLAESHWPRIDPFVCSGYLRLDLFLALAFFLALALMCFSARPL